MTQLELINSPFTQRVTFSRARNWLRPDAARNYGVIGTRITFVLTGPAGAVSWMISPNWHVKSSRMHLANFDRTHDPVMQPDAWDLSRHSYKPSYEGQTAGTCDLLDGGKCYCDGTSLGAQELVEGFLAGGDEWLWQKLREVYDAWFNDSPWPDFTPQYMPHPDDVVDAANEKA